MINHLSFFVFLVLNRLDFQYIKGMRRFNNLCTILRMGALRSSGARIGSGSIIRPRCKIVDPRNLSVGINSTIGSDSRIMNFSQVVIGDNVEIGPDAVFQTNEHIVTNYSIALGKQGTKFGRITVEDNCYLGGQVTLLQGVTISRNCIVGAKSLVNISTNVPGLYGGVPAKLKKEFGL